MRALSRSCVSPNHSKVGFSILAAVILTGLSHRVMAARDAGKPTVYAEAAEYHAMLPGDNPGTVVVAICSDGPTALTLEYQFSFSIKGKPYRTYQRLHFTKTKLSSAGWEARPWILTDGIIGGAMAEGPQKIPRDDYDTVHDLELTRVLPIAAKPPQSALVAMELFDLGKLRVSARHLQWSRLDAVEKLDVWLAEQAKPFGIARLDAASRSVDYRIKLDYARYLPKVALELEGEAGEMTTLGSAAFALVPRKMQKR